MALRRAAVGVALDIDGVLIRGSQPASPRACEAIKLLHAEKVPHVLLTNGGGMYEAEKARVVREILGLNDDDAAGGHLAETQIVLSHTPMQALTASELLRDEPVLIVGHGNVADIALRYGFRAPIEVREYAALNPLMNPLIPYGQAEQDAVRTRLARRMEQHAPAATTEHVLQALADTSGGGGVPAVRGAFIFSDPVLWEESLQILFDLSSAASASAADPFPLYFSNDDLLYAGEFPRPRLGGGAFKRALAAIFYEATGRPLPFHTFGKPHEITFAFARDLLNAQAAELGYSPAACTRLFMVGDNPYADILGANRAGSPWESALVQSGVFTAAAADALPEEARPMHTFHDVFEAVTFILDARRDANEV